MKKQTVNTRARRDYWVSNNYGNSDPYECSSIQEVAKILKNEASAILMEQGYVAGGYNLFGKNYTVVSNGEFRLENGKAIFYPDWTEKEEC